ncbi:MAG: hypothetical protein BRD23_07680 [Halobacteriales archaeon SW_9_67_25]|nr:MAG: hypothetical protein BRD23_07680 [Halobacteriales archaeon SW_9_67_25]
MAGMATHIGVCWASTGWFGVVLRNGDWTADHFPSVWSLWKYHSDADRILVDVPVGLPMDARRACDVEAKRKLRPHGRRICYAPVREAVYEGNLDDAKETNEAAGYSIQNQAWPRVPRVREVDEFIDENPGARDRLRETRPELCFYALNGHNPVADSKRTDEGIRRRLALLADELPDATAIYEACRDRYMTPRVTARRSADDLSELPERADPPRDERGLPMRIVYPSDVNQTRLTTLAGSSEE